MRATLNDQHWLTLITQCRSSDLTDRQWCIENGISASTFYYHVRALRKKACEIPEAVDAAAQKQEVVQIPLLKMEQHASDTDAFHMPSICCIFLCGSTAVPEERKPLVRRKNPNSPLFTYRNLL